ncbi:MAG TPA: Stp1/IreP family PP2C-type Ser/Thr phosphatase [Solirubrobacteraceae bacterium]|jgi:serine/threonine protein phosphatase PrpC|nr:Stp1/IreP family PP2C-type Ser/Thr phosphatase [Solirubrobacteraceae bacterium]
MLRVAEQYAATDTGRQRRANEDSLLAHSPLFVVADGMGGAQAGEVASRIAVNVFEEGLGDTAEPESGLAARASLANARIHELSHSNAEHAGMGTTLTAVYVTPEEVAIAHVGDSRAYRLRAGEFMRLTDDHSLVDELLRQGKITPEEAVDHPQRSVITRALGPEPAVEVDTRSFLARAGDVYLLCSDGLTTMLAEERVAELMRSRPRLRDAGEALIAAANEAGGRDNITVVLFRLDDPSAPAPQLAPETEEQAVLATATPDGRGQADAVPNAGAPPEQGAPPDQSELADQSAPPEQGEPDQSEPADQSAPPEQGEPGALAPTASPRRPVRPRSPRLPTSAPSRRSKRKRLRRLAPAAIALVVLGLLASGAYLAAQSVYFIGTNARGLVTLYRGVPYQLPGGIDLYSSDYVSGVSASALSPVRRRTLLDQTLRSQADATDLMRSLELGQLGE